MTDPAKRLGGGRGELAWRRATSSWWPGLAVLLLIAFAPILGGRNFLPFNRYNVYAMGINRGDFVPYDGPFIQRSQMPGTIQEPDVAPVVIFWPQDLFTAHSLRRGRLPLWNPYTGCGVPTFDGGQFRPLNPFRFPFYLSPSTCLWSVTLVLQLLAGAWGAAVWLRRRSFEGAAKLVGVGFFVLNPWVLERLPYPDAAAYLMLPWCAISLERVRWGSWGRMGAAALAFALMGHVSHPEAALLMALMSAAMAWETREERSAWRFLLALAAVGMMAGAAMAILWLPPLRLFFNGHLYKAEKIIYRPYAWRNLFLLASDLLLIPAGLGLLVAGLFARRGRPISLTASAALSALALFSFPLAGYSIGGAVQKLSLLPPYYFKAPLWAGVCLLMPFGWKALTEPGRRWIRPASLAVAIAGLSGVLVLALRMPVGAEVQSVHFSAALALVALSTSALFVAAASARGPNALKILAVLVLLPLAFPLALNQLDWNAFDLHESPWVTWLRRERPHERVVSLHFPWDPIPPNTGQALDVRCSESIGVLFPNLYHQLYCDLRQSDFPSFVVYNYPDWPRFNGLGATLLLATEEAHCDRSGAVFTDKGVSIIPMPHSTGRLYFAQDAHLHHPGQELVREVESARGEDAMIAVVDKVPPGLSLPSGPVRNCSAVFLEDEAERVTIEASSEEAALLVLKDTWYPGWEATLDGASAPILRVNGCFRGVILPRGRHSVRFAYRPFMTYGAGAVTLLALAGLVALFACSRFRHP